MRAADARATKKRYHRARLRFSSPLVAAALLLTPLGDAVADEDRDRARAAYDRGAAAHDRGDHAAAARAFAEADALAPNPVTLRVALDAAVQADDAVLVAELVERAEGRAPDASLDPTLKAARQRFAGRTGRVRVLCGEEAAPCSAALDGEAIPADKPVRARVGAHEIVVAARGARDARRVVVEPDRETLVDVRGLAPSAPPSTSVPQAIFFVGLGLTAILGAATVASAVDTKGQHDSFLQNGCAGSVHGDCSILAENGMGAQTRTNILIGVTAALGAGTAVLGVLSFRARGEDRAAVSLGVRAGGPVATLTLPLP
jgi:hypothetical protein